MIHDEWGVPERKLCSIPNGVDVRRFCPAKDDEETCQNRIQLNLSRTDHVVVCVANLYAIKGLDVLVRAWRQVSMVDPSARLVVAGLGPRRTELEQQANELRCGSTVRFLGFTENVSALLRCADLFVLPSRYEACSNGVLEAMATGLPVVASDVGGMRELITPNRTGWLVPSDSPDRLAETILAASLDQPARQRIGQAARSAVVEQFTLKTCVGRYASLYRELSGRDHAQPDAAMETLACAG